MKYQAYAEYKDSGVKWLGEVPKHWKTPCLRWYINIASGEGLSNTDFDKVYDEVNRFRVIGGNGTLGYSAHFNTSSKAFAIGRVGALCGNIHFINEICWITDNALKLSAWVELQDHYFFFLLKAAQLNEYASTTAQPLITGEQVKALRIVIPPIGEQKKIANFLDHEIAKIDTLIEKQQQLIKLLKEKRQAVISHAVTKGLNPNAPMRDSGVEWLGQVPEHWSIKKLKYLGVARNGLTYAPDDIVEPGEGVLVLRSSNVQNMKITFDDNVFVNKQIQERMITKLNDILICSRNGSRALIGKNALIDDDSAGLSYGAFMMIYRSEINTYLFYVFNSALFSFQSGTFLTSTINQLTVENLDGFEIPVPPNDEREEIIRYLKNKTQKIDDLIAKAESAVSFIKERRTALISAAVTGKIDVRNWQAQKPLPSYNQTDKEEAA